MTLKGTAKGPVRLPVTILTFPPPDKTWVPGDEHRKKGTILGNQIRQKARQEANDSGTNTPRCRQKKKKGNGSPRVEAGCCLPSCWVFSTGTKVRIGIIPPPYVSWFRHRNQTFGVSFLFKFVLSPRWRRIEPKIGCLCFLVLSCSFQIDEPSVHRIRIPGLCRYR